MQIVIDIPEEMIKALKEGCFGAKYNIYDICGCVMNGTPLPKGHGDLVDRDKVIDLLNEEEYNYYTELDKVCDTIYEAPTIIEADKGDEE